MQVHETKNFRITLNRKGLDTYTKASYAIRYGEFSEIQTPEFIYHFNLNGEIKHIQGRNGSWPDPVEWLKRTVGNEWVYYSSGGYAGVFDCMGEYYIPCFPYTTTSFINAKPFQNPTVTNAIGTWPEVVEELYDQISADASPEIMAFLEQVRQQKDKLDEKARIFHELIDGEITVLPPDTRHADYDVIPVTISNGCLYNCGFCKVKYGKSYKTKSKEEIEHQIHALRNLYDRDIKNYNAVFLGQHDALFASPDIILFAAEKAYDTFEFKNSYMKAPHLSLFGSVKSLLSADESLFEGLNRLPYQTYINIGLESADQDTLKWLKKPIIVEDVVRTFDRMMEINKTYPRIEITANFVIGCDLSEDHFSALMGLIRDRMEKPYFKGTIYLSPLHQYKNKRHVKDLVHHIKNAARLPVFYYLIQRL